MSAYTDERGEYAFDPIAVRPGMKARVAIRHRWYEELSDPSRWPEHLRVPSRFHVDRDVEIADLARCRRLDVTLYRGLTIRGRVLDPHGEPLTGTKIWCGSREARPEPDGRFELRGVELSGGRIAFSRHVADRPLCVPPQDAEALVDLGDIVLRPRPEHQGPRIEGTLRGPDGRALTMHSIEATGPLGAGSRGFTQSDREGRFELDLRSPGPCRIRSTLEVYGGTLEIDEPIEPADGPFNLRFPSRGLIWLRFEGDSPVGVELFVDGAPVGSAARCVRPLPLLLSAGEHRLRVLPIGPPAAELDVTVDPEAPARTVGCRLLR